ncbi:MAG: hypothetical protein K6F82_06810 [Sphaerochaetaceae bacterium]|nr:hypothetical protein [Sphaerochaetaceae bacterium]
MGNLSSREIRNTIAEVKSAVSRWKDFALRAGLSENSSDEIWSIIQKV